MWNFLENARFCFVSAVYVAAGFYPCFHDFVLPLYSLCFWREPEVAQKKKEEVAKRPLEVSHELVLISLLNNQLEQRGFAA